MKTLKEYINRNSMPFGKTALLVCPAKEGFHKHIFTYSDIRITLNGELCNVGDHSSWRTEFSEYTSTWIPTTDVLVVES
jgi:hypothetical protein